MASIFTSYRQADSEGHVGRLYDHLRKVYAEKEIFRDLDSSRAEIFDVIPNSDGSYAGRDEYNRGRSNEITFEVKAGRVIEFLLEPDTSPHTNAQLPGKRRLTTKPYTSIYKP